MSTPRPNRARALTMGLLMVLSTTAALSIIPTASAAGPLVFGPPEPVLAGLPAWVKNAAGPECYPEILVADLPDPLAPLSFPDNVPEEFAYYDLRTPGRSPVLGGGTFRFRDTLQGFGLNEPEPIIRNFVRLTLEGVAPGTYAVISDPQGTLQGTTFVVDGPKTLVEFMILSPGDVSNGPVHDLSIRGGDFTLARDGFVVAHVPATDFAGCAPTPVVGGPVDPNPRANAVVVCGFLTCAFDGSTSFPGAGHDWSSVMWEFGNGLFSNNLKTVHTYTAPGTYLVNLSVLNTNGTMAWHNQSLTVWTGAAPPPVPESFVSFNVLRTNNFLGIIVSPVDLVTGVAVSINGAPLQPMNAALNEGEWRLASPPRDVVVQFTATLTDGRSVTSMPLLWPSLEPA